MIQIIDGKRFSTDIATQVFEHENGHFVSDFKYRSKTLYQTKNGAWFIHHVGGAMSDMSVSVGNNGRGGSECIEAIDADDAYSFLEAHSDDSKALEAMDRYFADKITDA